VPLPTRLSLSAPTVARWL